LAGRLHFPEDVLRVGPGVGIVAGTGQPLSGWPTPAWPVFVRLARRDDYLNVGGDGCLFCLKARRVGRGQAAQDQANEQPATDFTKRPAVHTSYSIDSARKPGWERFVHGRKERRLTIGLKRPAQKSPSKGESSSRSSGLVERSLVNSSASL